MAAWILPHTAECRQLPPPILDAAAQGKTVGWEPLKTALSQNPRPPGKLVKAIQGTKDEFLAPARR
jgi:hypothetical protein